MKVSHDSHRHIPLVKRVEQIDLGLHRPIKETADISQVELLNMLAFINKYVSYPSGATFVLDSQRCANGQAVARFVCKSNNQPIGYIEVIGKAWDFWFVWKNPHHVIILDEKKEKQKEFSGNEADFVSFLQAVQLVGK